MVELSYIARSDGILALENEVVNDTTFMQTAVNLLLEVSSEDIVEKTLKYSILSDGYTNTDLLSRLIIIQGLTSIFRGYRPYLVAHMVGAMLGEKYILEIIDTTNITVNLNDSIDNYTVALPESIDFEKRLLSLTRAELSCVLMPMSSEFLAIAFRGCNKSFINKMRDGLSIERFKYMCHILIEVGSREEKSLDHISNKKETLEYQDIILQQINDLENRGVIMKIDL